MALFWDHKRISYSISWPKRITGRATALKQGSIRSKDSETDSEAVGVSEAFDGPEEVLQARGLVLGCCGLKRNEKISKVFKQGGDMIQGI